MHFLYLFAQNLVFFDKFFRKMIVFYKKRYNFALNLLVMS